MIDNILQNLQQRLQEDLKDTEDIYKILEDDSISYERRLKATTLMFQLHGKTDRLRYAIGLIKDLVEQEKLFNQATNQQYSKEKHIVYTQDKINEDIEEPKEKCNCEKNHNKTHTKEDDEKFQEIKEQLEILKQYVSEEIQGSIDNFNFWYEKLPNSEQCSLNDYKKYIKAILVVVYKTKRESDVWNKIMDQIVIINRMIKIKE